MLNNIFQPYHTMQEMNLDWILTKVKNILRFVPDDGAVGQILRRTAHGAEWSNEQGGGGAVNSVNGQTGDVVLTAADVGALPDTYSAPVDSVNGQTGTVVLGKSDIGLGNVDNVQQYSATNPPPYPVTSVNGQTGAVTLSIPTNTSDLNNDSGFVDSAGAAAAAPVQSINGQTGAVSISIPKDEYNVGDVFTFGNSTFYGYIGNYVGTMYVVLPKVVGNDVTSFTTSYTNFGWIMRSQQALSSTFSVTSVSLSGGNMLAINFSTDIHTNTYYQPVLININGLKITFTGP